VFTVMPFFRAGFVNLGGRNPAPVSDLGLNVSGPTRQHARIRRYSDLRSIAAPMDFWRDGRLQRGLSYGT